MANDIIGLELEGIGDGEVTLEKFADSVTRLRSLLRALTREIAGNSRIDWVIESLEKSSALQRYKGISKRPEDQEAIEQIVKAYAGIGKTFEQGQRITNYPESLIKHANKLVELIDDQIDYIRFETPTSDAVVHAPKLDGTFLELPAVAKGLPQAFGAVEGRVQMITSRGSLRFTLYDLIYDRGVSCYLSEGQQDMMLDIWGQLAMVEGLVRRDSETGKPLTIRGITSVTVLPERGPTSHKNARGIARSLRAVSSEEAIRRVRDAE